MDPILIITGPTAVGKTSLSLDLAEMLGAEIISADSRQIYRGLDIGTAKPSRSDLRRAPHHFVDELDLDQPYSAGQFQADANRRISEIHGRGKTALIAGGSTLYIHALKEGLADIPNVPPAIREEIANRLSRHGSEALFAELQRVDPDAAETMDPTKTQRLVRALAVYHATGRPLTSYYRDQPIPPYQYRTFVLHCERSQLYQRINTRVEMMLEAGLVEEVRALLENGFDPSLNPLRTIGYQEPIQYLNNDIEYDQMVRLLKRNTRRYAKRQLTWFRRDEENTWLDADTSAQDMLKALSDNS